jgi:hypothetical protein
MKSSTLSFSVVSLFLGVLLSSPTLDARAADPGSLTLAQAPSSNQQHSKRCRARYHDCLSRKQIPPFECRAVYQDCTRSMI